MNHSIGHGVIGAIMLLITVSSFAQPAKTDRQKTSQATKAVHQKQGPQDPVKTEAAQPKAVDPTGPLGIGPIQIGMTKDAILAMADDEPVKLVDGMSPVAAKPGSDPETEIFEALLVFPPKTDRVKTRLKFQLGRLNDLSLSTEGESTILDGIARQIAERYGSGKVEDDRKDEQCIYKNGNNFKIKSGSISSKWTTPDLEGKTVTTVYLDTAMRTCPIDLRYPSSIELKLKHLYIRLPGTGPIPQKKSLF